MSPQRSRERALFTRTYRIIPVGDIAATRGEVEWPWVAGYERIRALIEPHLGGEPLEHVSVLHEGQRRDMFVSELGRLELLTRGPLPRNDRATAIYRTNWLTRNPSTIPEALPWIAGVAVLFEERVWL